MASANRHDPVTTAGAVERRRGEGGGGVTIPTAWFNGAILLVVSTVGSGAWYMADQAAEIRGLKAQVVKEEVEASAARKTADDAMSALRLTVNAIDTRATRMESQLIFITDQIRPSGKR